jgi:hypothetical protein
MSFYFRYMYSKKDGSISSNERFKQNHAPEMKKYSVSLLNSFLFDKYDERKK